MFCDKKSIAKAQNDTNRNWPEAASPNTSTVASSKRVFPKYQALQSTIIHLANMSIIDTMTMLTCSSMREFKGLIITPIALLEYMRGTKNIDNDLPAPVAKRRNTSCREGQTEQTPSAPYGSQQIQNTVLV